MDTDITAETLVYGVAGVGSANWAAQEFLDFNLVTEIMGSSPELGYAIIGAAGVVSVTEKFGITEVFD